MFVDEFPDFLHSLSDSIREVIIMGDFNNFHFDNQLDSELRKLMSLLKNFWLQNSL